MNTIWKYFTVIINSTLLQKIVTIYNKIVVTKIPPNKS